MLAIETTYEIDYSDNPGPEPDPVWPDKSLPELAEIAFKKTGRLIDTLDHSVIKYLVVGCDVLDCLPYRHVVVADFEFEFGDRDGNLPRVVCGERVTHRHHRAAVAW